MENIKKTISTVLIILLVIMWVYSGISKYQEFERFGIELNRSPYLHQMSKAISYLLPLGELLLACLLIPARTRLVGLYLSLFLMVFFTVYIYAMLNYSYYISCGCMGLFEKLSWEEHLSFNMMACLLCIVAILLHRSETALQPYIMKRPNKSQKTVKQRLSITIALILLGVGSMAILHYSTDMPNRKNNGFERQFMPVGVRVLAQETFIPEFRELIGTFDGRYYLMGQNPSIIYSISEDLQTLDSIKLRLEYVPNFIPRFYGLLEYPLVHLLGGNAHTLITAHLEKDSVSVIPLSLPGFLGSPVLLDSDRFMLRVIDSASLDAYFVSMDRAGQVIQEEQHLSRRLGDAGFLSSGQLRRDPVSGKLSYVHFNDHHWMSFEPDFQLHVRSHTIDTNAHVKTEILRHGKNVNYKKPPLAVNAFSSAHGEVLHIRSRLRADNESQKAFGSHAVIDCYQILTGEYLGSYYLPQSNKHEVKQFYCLDHGKVIALSGGTVTVFQIHSNPTTIGALGSAAPLHSGAVAANFRTERRY